MDIGRWDRMESHDKTTAVLGEASVGIIQRMRNVFVSESMYSDGAH